METMQESVLRGVIQFCMDHDNSVIQKENFKEFKKGVKLDKNVFNRLFRQYLEEICDVLLDKSRRDVFNTHSYPVSCDDELDSLDVPSEEWKRRWSDFREWVATCNPSYPIPGVDAEILFSYTAVCEDKDRFDALQPCTSFFPNNWSPQQLSLLCEKLIENGYIASDTRVEHFVCLFQDCARPDGWKPVKWIKKTAPKGSGYQPGKKVLLNLLWRMGLHARDVRNWPLLSKAFEDASGNPMKYEGDSRLNHDEVCSSMYDEDICKIIDSIMC